MDDFNNFFDDQRQQVPEHTPIYHTPEPKNKTPKSNLTAIFCIIIAVIMCVLVVVNVIVLATLKNSIATEYASQMSAQMREQYEQAIKDALNDANIVDDVTDNATKQVIDAIDSTIGEIANGYSASVARLYMSADNSSGLATGFLISDTNEDGTLGRYVVTNAHCVRYAQKVSSGSIGGWWGGGTTYRYQWASYNKIVCVFEGEEEYYNTEIVAYGSYTAVSDDGRTTLLAAENDQPDLAILRITGTQSNPKKQPSNDKHPSLRLESTDEDITRGTPVALIGNPEGVGEMNTITSGTISQTGITIASWGPGTFLMTDAAVNGGNSGGPMIDRRGVVVGVVESKLASDDIDNMGFALSAETLHDFIDWVMQSKNITINCQYV